MAHTHEEQHFESSDFLRDVVIGMSDGLTVPFALAAGLSGAVASNKIVLTAGFAEIVAGAIAMGLGGYLAGRTELEHYESELAREHDEVKRLPEVEKAECQEIFENMGISPELSAKVVEELAKNETQWVNFMMRFELGLEKPDPARALKSAANIGGAYVVGGLVPLAAYAFFDNPDQSLRYSVVSTLVVLSIFGYLKSHFLGQNVWKGAIQTVLIGATAAAAAYFVAKNLG